MQAARLQCKGFERKYSGTDQQQLLAWINDVVGTARSKEAGARGDGSLDTSDAWLSAKVRVSCRGPSSLPSHPLPSPLASTP
eukprot:COSAG01_NODE_4392_length_5071_cov_14.381738_6_plen_82_part_00